MVCSIIIAKFRRNKNVQTDVQNKSKQIGEEEARA